MFRLAFFVEDKNLAKVLVAVQGLALNMEVPQPVVNATVVKGKVRQETAGGTIMEMLTHEISQAPNGYGMGIAEFRSILKKVGGADGSTQTYLQRLKAARVLKKGKRKGQYIVLNGKEI